MLYSCLHLYRFANTRPYKTSVKKVRLQIREANKNKIKRVHVPGNFTQRRYTIYFNFDINIHALEEREMCNSW